MSTLSENVKLFFVHPRKLFLGLKETPDLARTSALLLIQVIALQMPNLKLVSSRDYGGTAIAAILISTLGMIGIAFLGVLWGSVYAFMFCRFFGRKPKFKSIVSGLIYCRIPIIVAGILYTLYPLKTDLISIIKVETIHPFLKEALRGVEPFGLWIAAVEVVAVAIIAEISYLKSSIVVFTSMVLGIVMTYFFGLKFGAY